MVMTPGEIGGEVDSEAEGLRSRVAWAKLSGR